MRTLNSAVVHRQLATAPRMVVVTSAPQTEVKTTRTTTVVETAERLDDESRAALRQVADVIQPVGKTKPGAVYDVLTKSYGVSPGSLSAPGYGESFPMYPEGNDAEMRQDRRVLVVRTK